MQYMQVLSQTFKVEENSKKEILLSVLSDRYSRAILEAIIDKPKSTMEITAETGIPISTVYRRIQMLHDGKLLNPSGSISEDGKKFFLYKSKVKEINTSFNNGLVEVEIVPNRSN